MTEGIKSVDLFQGTAQFYDYRAPYAPKFFRKIAGTIIDRKDVRMVDLASATGPVAQGLAPFVQEILLVDSSREMIEAARQKQFACDVDFLCARVEDIPPDIGPFDIATIGRAVHWLDREKTIDKLKELMKKGGFIVVCDALTNNSSYWYSTYSRIRHIHAYGINIPRRTTLTTGALHFLRERSLITNARYGRLNTAAYQLTSL